MHDIWLGMAVQSLWQHRSCTTPSTSLTWSCRQAIWQVGYDNAIHCSFMKSHEDNDPASPLPHIQDSDADFVNCLHRLLALLLAMAEAQRMDDLEDQELKVTAVHSICMRSNTLHVLSWSLCLQGKAAHASAAANSTRVHSCTHISALQRFATRHDRPCLACRTTRRCGASWVTTSTCSSCSCGRSSRLQASAAMFCVTRDNCMQRCCMCALHTARIVLK